MGAHDRDHMAAIRAIAESHGGECLSPQYVDSQTKLRFRCARGHEWEARPNAIKQGKWCRICACEEMRGKPRKRAKPRMPGHSLADRVPVLSSELLSSYKQMLRELLTGEDIVDSIGFRASIELDDRL